MEEEEATTIIEEATTEEEAQAIVLAENRDSVHFDEMQRLRRIPITTPTRFRRHFPHEEPFDTEYAKSLEDHIARHSKTITKIELFARYDCVSNRYVEAVLRGMIRGGTKDRALEEMKISGDGFTFHKALLSKILLLAPKKLELDDLTMEHIDDDGGGHGSDGDFSWANCVLEDLNINLVYATEEAYVNFLNLLGNLSTLKKVLLNFYYDEDSLLIGWFEEAREATEELVPMLDHNPHLETLHLPQMLPETDLFCQQLKRCRKLKELRIPLFHPEVSDRPEDYEKYFKALVEVLKGHDIVLEELRYVDWGEYTEWGPSSIKYYLALNAGKRFMNSTSLSGMGVLQCIAPYFPRQQPRPASGKDWAARAWAYSADEQEYKDICMIYGLLHESPGTWSKMAIEACCQAERKPAAYLSDKRQADSIDDTSSKKKSRLA